MRLPYSPDAEQAVLGAILLDRASLDQAAEILPSSEYFYIATHRTIYSAMLRMYNEGRPVDMVTLIEELKREPDFDEATTKTYLVQMAQSCPSISNLENYCRLVRDKHDVRSLITAANEIIEDSSDGAQEPQMLIDSAEQKIFDIRRGKDIQGLQRIDEVLFQTFNRLDMLNRDDEDIKPVSTGISDLDRVITGLNRSDLILLAARPGMGKTSFALNIARNVAATSKKTVAFFSLEMTKEQLASRLLSAEALVGGTKLRTGRLNNEEWQRLVGAGDVLKNVDLYLDDTPGITVPEMKSKLRRLRKIDLVVIDYLQLMSTGRRNDNRVQEISEITRNLKILAKEINVPVICLSQLSRASEQRQDHRPQLSDLRDSGSIEQDADIVLFLYRDGYYEREKGAETVNAAIDQNSGECIVAKNRHGETTSVKLHWQGEFMRFTGIDHNRD
ncbi:MAG: replicative DNA helicase [Ruminococcus sp.]|nr:replicative DNA helicase [Ruminococcus sp.]